MTPDVLARIHAAAFAGDEVWDAAGFARLLASPGVILCGDARAFVLGRVTVDEAEVLTLATHPDYRRLGFGRAALTAFEAAAQEAGALSCFLEVAADNAAALALYARSGLETAGRRRGYYRRPGMPAVDALILRKRLTKG